MAFRKLFKIFSWITGISVGTPVILAVIAVLAAAVFVRTDFFQNSLRDRLVKVAHQELGLEIKYESATISLFSLEPKIEFKKIRLSHPTTKVHAEIETLGAGISLFVSVPLLFVRTLHLSSVSMDGLRYELASLKPIREWIEILRPRHEFLPTAFHTSIGQLQFSNIDVEISLPESEFYGQGLAGNIFMKVAEVDLGSEGISFSGDIDLNGMKSKTYGPLTGNIILSDGLHVGDRTRFGHIRFSHDDDEISVSGDIKNWESPVLGLKGKGGFAIENYIPDFPITGRVTTDFALEGPYRQLKGKGSASFDELTLRGKKWTQLKTTWKLDSSRIEINTIESGDQKGQSKIRFVWPFSKTEKSFLSVNFNEAQFKDYAGVLAPRFQIWDGLMSGELTFDGQLGKKIVGEGRYNLKVKGIRINAQQDFPVYETADAAVVGSLKVLDDGRGELSGRIHSLTFGLGYKGAWNSLGIRMDIFGSFPGGSAGKLLRHQMDIKGNLKAVLEGPWKQVQLTIEPVFSEFSLDNYRLTQVSGRLIYLNKVLSGVPIHADQLSVYGGIFFNPDGPSEFSNFRFTTRKLDPGFMFTLVGLQNDLVKSIKGKMTAKGTLRGPLKSPIGSGAVTLEDWAFYKMVTKGKVALGKWATAGADIFFDQTSIQFSDEEVPLIGEMSFDGDGLVDLSLESNRIRFASLQDLQGLSLPVQSFASVRVDYQRELPSLRINSRFTKTFISGNEEPDSEVSIDWIKDQAKVDCNLFGNTVKAHAEIKQTRQLRHTNISLYFGDFNLGRFSRSFNQTRLTTPVSGKGFVNFQQQRGSGNLLRELFETRGIYSGDISIDAASVVKSGVIIHNLDPAKIRVVTGKTIGPRFLFEKLIVRSEKQTLQASGFFESGEFFEAKMKGQLDLRSWAGLYPFLSRSEGSLDIDGVLRPEGLYGRMKILKGLLNFQNSPLFVRNVEASLECQGSSMKLSDLKGDFREGAITGDGNLQIENKKIVFGTFSARLQDTLFQPVSGISMRVSGPLNLKIVNDQGEVKGRISIRDGVYRRRLDAKADILKFFESSQLDLGSPNVEETPGWRLWKLNVDIVSEAPILVRNNLVDGNANLQLRAVGTFKTPRLQGSITILNGQFYYVNRQFTVRSGSIQFTDPTTNIPQFDIRADTEISDIAEVYRVFLRILGSADSQKISYSSEPPLSEKDILSLVVSGFRASDVSAQTQDPTKSAYYSGISFVTGQFQDRIERGLNTGLGIRRFGLSPSFSDTTKSTELQLTIGTDLIRNRLEVNYSNLLSTRGGHKVELELKMNRVVSLIGSWRNIEGGTEQDFGGDLRFRFEYE